MKQPSSSLKTLNNMAGTKKQSIVAGTNPTIVPVSSLTANAENITIIVRVIRSWDVCFGRGRDKPVAVEMVLVDNQGTTILGRMEVAYIYKFGSLLTEGSVVRLSNFKVLPANGEYRPTPHECKLNIRFHSIVEPMPPSEVEVPPYLFTPPEYCFDKDFNRDYLVDVVGLYIGNSDITKFESKGNAGTRMTVDLQNEGVSFTVTLFGDYATQMKEIVDSGRAQGAVIAVLYCKVSKWPGGTAIQTTQRTSALLINPEIPEAAALRESSQALTVTPLSSTRWNQTQSDEDAFLSLEQKYSLQDVRELTQITEFVTTATINSIVEGIPWWYWACREDHYKCTQEEDAPGLYYCPNCDTHVKAVVRKLILKLSIHDDTDCIIVTLFDNIVKMLTGKTAEDVYQSWKQDARKLLYPTELSQLIGREAIWQIAAVNKEELHYCRTYKATRASFAEVVITKYNEKWFSEGTIEGSKEGLLLLEDTPSNVVPVKPKEVSVAVSQDAFDDFQDSASGSTTIPDCVTAVDLTKDTEEIDRGKRKMEMDATSSTKVPLKKIKVEK